jgi:hypothetical protein
MGRDQLQPTGQILPPLLLQPPIIDLCLVLRLSLMGTISSLNYWFSLQSGRMTSLCHLYPLHSSFAEDVDLNCSSVLEAELRVGRPRFDSWQGQGFFSSPPHPDRIWVPPTQLPIQWVPAESFPGVKRPGREADHSPPSSTEVNNACRYISTPPYVFMA